MQAKFENISRSMQTRDSSFIIAHEPLRKIRPEQFVSNDSTKNYRYFPL